MFNCKSFDAAAFNRKLAAQRKVAEEKLKKACEKSARDQANLMARTAPVGPQAPHIRDTIEVEITADGATARVGSPETPAAPIEQGHMKKNGTHVPGARFFYPARKVIGKKHRGRVRRAGRGRGTD